MWSAMTSSVGGGVPEPVFGGVLGDDDDAQPTKISTPSVRMRGE
jgi:hypothetical protein